jgi:hypothetical protein
MIKFISLFLINFLIENWKKNLLIILSISLISLSYHLFKTDRQTSYINIESIFNDNGKWTYVTFNGRSHHFNKEQTTYRDQLNPNDIYIKVSETGSLFIIFTVFAVISSISTIVILFMEDWDAGYITRNLVNKYMKCDEEDGLWNYYSFGKLIDRKDHIYSGNYYQYIGFIEFIKLPKYISKSNKRDKKLKDLGI